MTLHQTKMILYIKENNYYREGMTTYREAKALLTNHLTKGINKQNI
jgi:hypothetical protein